MPPPEALNGDEPRLEWALERNLTPEELDHLRRHGWVDLDVPTKLYAGEGKPPIEFVSRFRLSAEMLFGSSAGETYEVSGVMADRKTWQTSRPPDIELPWPVRRQAMQAVREPAQRVLPRARPARRRSVRSGRAKARAPSSSDGDSPSPRSDVAGDPQFPRTPAHGCRRCGLDFTSLRAFDDHWRRWPDHGRGEFLPFDGADLIAVGFRQNSLGRWTLGKPMSEGARRVLGETVHVVETTP